MTLVGLQGVVMSWASWIVWKEKKSWKYLSDVHIVWLVNSKDLHQETSLDWEAGYSFVIIW